MSTASSTCARAPSSPRRPSVEGRRGRRWTPEHEQDHTGGRIMADQTKKTGSHVVASMRYRDAPAAIEWLCRAFGFEKHLVVPGENGTIAHAQLVFGNGMIMLGSARDDEWGKTVKTPADVGGVVTGAVYVIVADVDGHHARAAAAGARITEPPTDRDYGGRGYGCRDLEGYVWSFGSYDPWA